MPDQVKKPEDETFDWAQLRHDMDHDKGEKRPDKITVKEKFMIKFYDNPVVPIGCLATATCLIIGMGAFASKNTRMSQIMMRARVLAQGITVAGLLGGVMLKVSK